jgi:uncharacterized protein with HEPN domain
MTAKSIYDLEHLDSIIELIEHIQRRLDSMSFKEFEASRDELDLTAYRLSVIGETTNRLSEALKSRHPSIPWRAIYVMRNVISHEYRGLIPKRVWDTARNELEPLAAVCRAELAAGKLL